MRVIVVALALALACLTPSPVAKGGEKSHDSAAISSHSHTKAAPWVHRDSHGKTG
jgi:hypothetical protein